MTEKRKKIGERLVATGFLVVIIFGMALDGPGNHMPTICTGILMGAVMMLVGAGQAQILMRGSEKDETQISEETDKGTEETYRCYRP